MGGGVAKFMGDGVLAYFGWPTAHEDEVERAVRAGLAIVRAVAGLQGGGAPLGCRVGIATGLVVVGDLVGEGASQEEGVVGPAPNLAARLQQLAGPGEVVVAEATRRRLGARFVIDSLGLQALKGVEPASEAFRVLGERPVESRFAAHAGEAVLPIVGRDEELALLLRRWREAQSGEGRAVVVAGEAGIGKSRLVQAFREEILAERPSVHLYQCSPLHSSSPLWPVARRLEFAAGFEPGDDAATRWHKLGKIAPMCDNRAPLAALLGVAAECGLPAIVDRAELRRGVFQALVGELRELAAGARAPVLILVEDTHWLDPSTTEFVQLALEAIAALPVMLVLTSRLEGEPALRQLPHLSRIVLSRLDHAAAEAIVEGLAAATVDGSTRAQIRERAEGVPLYLEELTRAVSEVGSGSGAEAVPASLEASLLARLDRDPAAKQVAQLAACLGRDFDHRLLAAVAELPAAELGQRLDALVACGIFERRAEPHGTRYRFRHTLLRDAAYESLLRARRREIHGRIGAVLGGWPEAVATEPEVVAFHLAASAEPALAAPHWLAAGDRAPAARSGGGPPTLRLLSGVCRGRVAAPGQRAARGGLGGPAAARRSGRP